jgi:nucleotide-binding universal stress UspA family protein
MGASADNADRSARPQRATSAEARMESPLPNRRILLVDSPDTAGETAVERCAGLALARGVPVTVLVVASPTPGLFRSSAVDVPGLVLAQCSERAQATADARRARGVEAEARVRTGIPIVEIVREVLALEIQLVVKTQGGGGRRRPRLGGLDFQLLRKCPCPLLLCRTRDRLPHRRVAAAVDPCDPRQDRDFHLDDAILRWATAIAAVDGAELLALHAFDFPIEAFLRVGRGSIPPADIEAQRAATRDDSEASLSALLARHDPAGLERRALLLDGPAAEAIPDAVGREGIDLLVLGTVARAGIAGLLIGNSAEEILREVDCSVLAIKPAGFVSPVRPG